MHLHFERTVNARSDCPILSLTWMGKVPDELPEDEDWKLNRTNYYQEGWLATGNVRGIVGVTFTTSHCKKNVEFPLRTNYNLRGHRSEVILVKWNEPYQKLASCDSSGIIFVWIKYEGRWSIELINDRNTPVTHFSWSHDGRMALICYQDGFVLVGSVAGQRYWSSMLNLDATITCGIWTPDDQQVYFGTTSGQIIVMDVHGAMVSQVQLGSEVGITSMAWSCEKFKMEEGDDNDTSVTNSGDRKFVLAVSLQNGYIFLLSTFDDVSPIQINTGLQGPICMEWSNSREFLAVSGIATGSPTVGVQVEYTNMLKFYNEKGVLLYCTVIPDRHSRISTLTWGHNDKRLFLATGTQIHIAWVSKRIASLQLLCRLRIHNLIPNESQLASLPLPLRLRNIIGNLFAQTIRCCVPEPSSLREFVSRPPVGSVRLHCTMIRHDEENNLTSGTCYTLYLEYLGGLVPLLKGKRTSKIRPEFVIFDPQVEDYQLYSSESKSSSSSSNSANGGCNSDTSDSDREDGCTGSPRMQRRRKRKNKYYSHVTHHDRQPYQRQDQDSEHEDLSYVDTLPEQVRLVEVTSNIWGTKFKIHGLATSVPVNLGQVTYKTSLLHLQPRQMTLVMTELRDDFPVGPDPTFNPNLFSEDEEEVVQPEERSRGVRGSIDIPIAPMSPRGNVLGKQKCSYLLPEQGVRRIETPSSLLAKPESYDEKCCYVEVNEVVSLSNNDQIRPQASSSTSNGALLSLRPTSTQSTSFIGQFMQNGAQNGGSQRHAISPICCEVSVPALQSPKNAVAPSDIIFDRPPASTIISYSASEYFNGSNALQVKSSLVEQTAKNISVTFGLNGEQHKPIVIKKIQEDSPVDSKKAKQAVNESLNRELKFIDEENSGTGPSTSRRPPPPTTCLIDSMVRSCSVGFLDMVDAQLVPSDASLLMLRKEFPKRLVLVNKKPRTKRQSRMVSKPSDHHLKASDFNPRLKNCGKSKSLDSSDIFPSNESSIGNIAKKKPEDILEVENSAVENSQGSDTVVEEKNNSNKSTKRDFFSSPLMRRKKTDVGEQNRGRSTQKKINQQADVTTEKNGVSIHTQALANLEKLITRLREDDGKSSPSHAPRLPRSSPSSPAPTKKGIRPQSASPIRRKLLSSPLLGRRNRKNKNQESSDDEVNASGDEIFNGTNYKDLETFQKSQLRQKLKRGKIEPNGSSCNNPIIPQRREFVMHNKAPMWNENSQVYQLDFGGRVTQESAKNFQIEFRGKQVMQFGRIDGNAYTLDFQYPFSALQAFAVALANVTQRLK
ncbi:tubby-related protein 4 [Anoplophora glabripennis]|uniref:tubby-related protein 4 n=1 Tax=Anoplophora glabripennis TaxID=217634 RepID=UPI0008746CED|nr:tubby-related protein 4 [Anoplophora glabripennis]